MTKLLLSILLFISFSSDLVLAKRDVFLKEKAREGEHSFTFNQYEKVIGGGVAFLVGIIGNYTTESKVLKYAYSGVQTIGIVSGGQGLYDILKPNEDRMILNVMSKARRVKKESLSKFVRYRYLRFKAQKDYAFRNSLMATSSFLALQYLSSAALDKDTPSSLKNIYYFLGGVNIIIALNSYFYPTDYEKEFERMNRLTMSPALYYLDNKSLLGFNLTLRF